MRMCSQFTGKDCSYWVYKKDLGGQLRVTSPWTAIWAGVKQCSGFLLTFLQCGYWMIYEVLLGHSLELPCCWNPSSKA